MGTQLEVARMNLDLDELEDLLEQRRDDRVHEGLALQLFLRQVEQARLERDARRQENALEAWANKLSQRARYLRKKSAC